jgi:hypothetical protein
MRIRIELNIGGTILTVGDVREAVTKALDSYVGREGVPGPVHFGQSVMVKGFAGEAAGRLFVVDGIMGDPEPQSACKPYRFGHAKDQLTLVVDELRLLCDGIAERPDWRDLAATTALNLRVLASIVDGVRTGHVGVGEEPLRFPSIDEVK